MVNFSLYKNTLLKIRKSLGRYISLLIIVMVGVGFYAGIQITAPNITNVADSYYKDYKLMDFKIVSSMGLTDDDVYALKQLEGVLWVIPSFSMDVQSRGNVIRIHAIEDSVNIVKLTDGQMPLSDTECVADSRKYSIGDVIEVTGDVNDKIKNVVFTVVGLVDSVLYLHNEYGSTNIGNGQLSSFIFINKDNFILNVYTEIHVIIETFNAVAYSDEYIAYSVRVNDEIVKIKPNRENIRFDDIFNDAMKVIEENEAELNKEIAKVEKEFFDAKMELDYNLQELTEGKASGIKEFEEAKKVIDENAQKLRDTKNELIDYEKIINEWYEEYYVNLTQFNTEIAENEKKINEGYLEYYEKIELFNDKVADAKKEINNAKTELSDIKQSQWYIFNRNTAVGYDALGSGIQIVAVVATVFPLFFILISILMTSNSMSRMITEERGELGTLTSLGYRDREIISSYLLYVLSASGLGAVIGFFVGCSVFPPLIFANFTFILPPLTLEYNIVTFAAILLITFSLMISVTLFTCYRELKQKPASLMRPLPPKHGKQIFLEKVTFIWKRLSFTWKVTIRNMFRYKKRVFMTIVGVAGCASLLLIAFGVYDGMNGVTQKQYGDILRYNNVIILKDETQTLNDELRALLDKQHVTDPLLIRQNAYKCENNKILLDAFLIVPQDNELFEQYFNLKSTVDKNSIVLNDNDVIITQRIAVVYNFQKGDTITIKDTDNNLYNLIVSDIAENYVSNYIYVNTFTYNETFGVPVNFNAIVSNHNTNEPDLAESLIGSGLAINVIS
ncbi:MAG: FtsX-like permease family protein [Candidatus Bathyarchaeota archaeon]|nr:FtsX-like permease family protein [Candidatus Termiticorpusculum sp.]